MAKRTKVQMRRMAVSIRSKTFELYKDQILSLKDVDAIDKMVARAMNRLK
jgi:hypothetical protein